MIGKNILTKEWPVMVLVDQTITATRIKMQFTYTYVPGVDDNHAEVAFCRLLYLLEEQLPQSLFVDKFNPTTKDIIGLLGAKVVELPLDPSDHLMAATIREKIHAISNDMIYVEEIYVESEPGLNGTRISGQDCEEIMEALVEVSSGDEWWYYQEDPRVSTHPIPAMLYQANTWDEVDLQWEAVVEKTSGPPRQMKWKPTVIDGGKDDEQG